MWLGVRLVVIYSWLAVFSFAGWLTIIRSALCWCFWWPIRTDDQLHLALLFTVLFVLALTDIITEEEDD